MTLVQDRYASRVAAQVSLQPRQEPVVYSTGERPAGLTAAQVANYRDRGFLFLADLFTAAELEIFRQELARLAARPDIQALPEAIAEPDSGVVRSIFRVHQLSPIFAALCRDRRLLSVAEYILGDRAYMHQSRVNLKPGFDGKEFYWHSDFETWHAEDGMPTMRALSISLALTDNNEFNGPLMLIPSSHQHFVPCVGETPENHYEKSLRKQEYGVPDRESLTALCDRYCLVAPKGAAGSAICFDCNTLHGSSSNISPYPRSNVFFVYNSVENALQAPFCGQPPRPEFIASRQPDPLTAEQPDYAALQAAIA